MQTTFIIIALALGFAMWYVYYGIECAINGGTIARNPYTMHFSLFWEELLWFLPGGYARKRAFFLDRYGEFRPEEHLKMLPGRLHFMLTHVLIPLSPTLVVLLEMYYR